MTTTKSLPDRVVAKRRHATGAYGLYVEWAQYRRLANDPSKAMLLKHSRAFQYQNRLWIYHRDADNKRAPWHQINCTSIQEALDRLNVLLNNSYQNRAIVMVGTPLLVEMTPADILAINADKHPPARHAGVAAIEKAHGKFDPDTVWQHWADANIEEVGDGGGPF